MYNLSLFNEIRNVTQIYKLGKSYSVEYGPCSTRYGRHELIFNWSKC